MKIKLNTYTMKHVATLNNTIMVVYNLGRYLVCKQYKDHLKVFANCGTLEQATKLGNMM